MAIAPRGRSAVRIIVAGLTLAVLAVGCATLPPAKPVTSIGDVAGTWQGTVTTAATGPQPSTITINPDGSYSVVMGTQKFTGKMTVLDGKIRSRGDQTGAAGTWSLHDRQGTRVLAYQADDGRVTGEVTPAK